MLRIHENGLERVNYLKMYIVFFITMVIEDLVIFFEVTVFFVYCTLHLHLFILKSAILFILYILIKSGLHKFKYNKMRP